MKFPHRNPVSPPRRQRSASGAQAPVYSYYARRSQEQTILGRQAFREVVSRDTSKQVTKLGLKRLGILAVLVLVCGGFLNTLWLSSKPQVVPLSPDNTAFLHSQSDYEQAASTLFASSIMNRTKVTINVSKLTSSLKQRFPELGTISVSLPIIGHQPIIYIAPTNGRLLLSSLSGKTYVLDDNGRVITTLGNKTMASAFGLPLVADQSGTPVTVGKPILSSDTVAFIRTVAYEVTQQHQQISRFTLPSGESELDLYLEQQSYFVKFNLEDGSALQQVGTYLAVRHHLEGEGKTPAQYIDVRLAGRAYYK